MLSNLITIAIVVAILILFAMSMGKNTKRNYKNEIVSLGVLGTFLGIAVGLYHFDVSSIKDSLPSLLGGLKTAFITSGFGIFFSIIISIYKPFKQNNSVVLGALESIVQEFNNNLTKQFGDNFKQLNEAVAKMIIWQDNYKTQIINNEKSLNNVLTQLNNITLQKDNQEKNIEKLINNLASSSVKVKDSLEATTDIVKENMQLLLREANGKLL
jgi:biopolymer transport protein ExbB/TolQ